MATTIQDGSVTWKVTNLHKISSGSSSSGSSGDENVIESISLNGTTITPNNKNVNIVIPTASTSTNGLMSSSDKQKLDGITSGSSGGEANKINTIKVNGTALTPDSSKTVNIDLSTYAKSSDISSAINNIPNATTSTSGLMSSTDKIRLDGLVDTASSGGEANKIDSIALNGTTINPDSNKRVNINIPTASTTTNGLMSSSDKQKLNNINTDSYATKSELDSYTKTNDLSTTINNYMANDSLDTFNSTKNGLVPKSDGDVNKFLRADGTWTAPPSMSISTVPSGIDGVFWLEE